MACLVGLGFRAELAYVAHIEAHELLRLPINKTSARLQISPRMSKRYPRWTQLAGTPPLSAVSHNVAMKIAAVIARYLMGLVFTVAGLNGFLQFLPAPPMPGPAGQFIATLIASHYVVPVFLLQIICGILFLANRYVPLALTLIAPVIVNILLFHITMNPSGILPGLIVTVCWIFVFYTVRTAFAGILQSRPVS